MRLYLRIAIILLTLTSLTCLVSENRDEKISHNWLIERWACDLASNTQYLSPIEKNCNGNLPEIFFVNTTFDAGKYATDQICYHKAIKLSKIPFWRATVYADILLVGIENISDIDVKILARKIVKHPIILDANAIKCCPMDENEYGTSGIDRCLTKDFENATCLCSIALRINRSEKMDKLRL
jgi:hypothetical protein